MLIYYMPVILKYYSIKLLILEWLHYNLMNTSIQKGTLNKIRGFNVSAYKISDELE